MEAVQAETLAISTNGCDRTEARGNNTNRDCSPDSLLHHVQLLLLLLLLLRPDRQVFLWRYGKVRVHTRLLSPTSNSRVYHIC